jgi:uncharacterized protein (TIGR03437 family)
MPNQLQIIGAVNLVACLCASGQTGPTLIGSGYNLPTTLRLAPGQITTLFVTGLKTVLPPGFVEATTVPLPKTLAGISLTLSPSIDKESAVPLLSIQQTPVCSSATSPASSASTPDCLVTAITVQVPVNLGLVIYDPNTGLQPTPVTVLVLNENGSPSKAFNVIPAPDKLHVLSDCDNYLIGSFKKSVPVGYDSPCGEMVTHGDGTLVTAASPALAGESVVVYAVGLGPTKPVVNSGDATPSNAPIVDRTVFVQFDFHRNAAPSRPYPDPSIGDTLGLTTPEFVGLTPNQIGLYQINIQLPNRFPAVQNCSLGLACSGNPIYCGGQIQSNLTINIGGINSSGSGSLASFDGAPICVKAQ